MTESEIQPDLDGRVDQDIVRLYLTRWRGSLTAVTLFTLAAAVAARDESLRTSVIWCVLSCFNDLGQAFVSWRMEQSASLSEAIGGMLWGSVPRLRSSAALPVQLFASLFNLMLFFAVANAPSTRDMHDGLGLGLRLLQQRAQSLGGHIDIRSRMGEGTSVMLSLPVTHPAPRGHLSR